MGDDSEKVLMARICHDLITPVNAIGLGLDAFEMSRDTSMLAEVRNGLGKAGGILVFLRELFSTANIDTGYIAKSLQTQIKKFLVHYNVAFELYSQTEELPYAIGQIIMYAALIAKEVAPYGGKIYAKIAEQEISFTYTGQHLNAVDFCEDKLSYKNIFRAKMKEIFDMADATIYTDKKDDSFTISAKL